MREVGDRVELAEIVRARGRLHDEGEPGPVQDLRSLHCVPPGAAHLPEAVVTIGIESIEREREPPRSGLRETRRQILRNAHAVGADDDPEFTLRRAPDDLEDVAPQERLAARQDREAFRRERGDFVDDPEAFLGAELAPIGEVLGADQRRAAGVEVAVLAGEVAAVGQVPGDDVRPGEPFDCAQGWPPLLGDLSVEGQDGGLVFGWGIFIGARGSGLGLSAEARSAKADASHAEEVAGRVEDLLVHFEGPSLSGESLDACPRHGADELGNVREPRFGSGSPADRDWLSGVSSTFECSFLGRHHRGERARTRAARLR